MVRRAIAAVTLVFAVTQPLYAAPVYDPAARSYFELVNGINFEKGAYQATEGPTWEQALALAQQRVYMGVHGRLAIVKTISTHDFLETTFHPDSFAWIGLRYWCISHKLQWSDGQMVTRLSFAAWDKHWNQDVFGCHASSPAKDYMPIAYSPISAGFHWIGKGVGKRYYYYFVEYPTGRP